jgi:hypothetical protein
MEKVNSTVKIYAQMLTFLVIWLVIIIASGKFSPLDLWAAAKLIPMAVAGYAFVALIFTKWLWRCKFFADWLVKVPDLQGTWRGELKSDWIDPKTNQGIPPVPITLVIRQTFSNISCILMTKESSSYSTTANINAESNNENLFLTYNYTNRPKATLRDRSAIHDGAAVLKIVRTPKRILEGEYWTSRKTRGEITLHFQSHNLEEQFLSPPRGD